MGLRWWFESKDRQDCAVLHDALELRLRYGDSAETFCEQAMESRAVEPEEAGVLRELRRALKLLPTRAANY